MGVVGMGGDNWAVTGLAPNKNVPKTAPKGMVSKKVRVCNSRQGDQVSGAAGLALGVGGVDMGVATWVSELLSSVCLKIHAQARFGGQRGNRAFN